MKIEISLGKPAIKEHIGPHSQVAATVKVNGKAYEHTFPGPDGKNVTKPVEFVGADEEAAVGALCRGLLQRDTIAVLCILGEKAKAEEKAEEKADKKK